MGRIIVDRVDVGALPGSVAVDLSVQPDATDTTTDVIEAFLELVGEAENGQMATMGYTIAPGGRVDVAAQTARQDACTAGLVTSRTDALQAQVAQLQADFRLWTSSTSPRWRSSAGSWTAL